MSKRAGRGSPCTARGACPYFLRLEASVRMLVDTEGRGRGKVVQRWDLTRAARRTRVGESMTKEHGEPSMAKEVASLLDFSAIRERVASSRRQAGAEASLIGYAQNIITKKYVNFFSHTPSP